MRCINKKAFTLVELMLVVIIIGVLVAMVMPRLAGRTEQAKRTAAKADIEANIGSALDLYEVDNGSFPESLDELQKNTKNLTTWKGPYIKKKPIDPWGTIYDYKYSAADNTYILRSFGKDHVEGGNDDITNGDEDKAK